MSKFRLPVVPNNYHLEKAFLSTFDLDENILSDLIDKNDANKFLIVRGDGEYVPHKDDNNPIKDRVAPIFFELTDKKLQNGKYQPVSFHHAKIWWFIYENDAGNKISKLIIQSKNIHSYDSIEVQVSFLGERASEKQSKNNPLKAYFESLLPFLNGEKADFIQSLIEEIPYYSFKLENNDYQADDFEFITPYCKDSSLFSNEYDEILIIAPFINVETINALLTKKKEGGRCVILSQAKINESLIISDVKGVQYLSPNVPNKFVHSKVYLVRRDSTWDLYVGSMNLSDYSVNKNIEAMVHLKNVKNINNIESFLKQFIGCDFTDELKQYSQFIENKEVSPIFNDASKIETRIQYIKKLLLNKKHDEEYMNQVSSYLLSSQSVKDLKELIEFKKDIIPARHVVITGKGKKRYVYKLSFKDNTLLGLFNYSLHKYDYLFSKNVFLHILDRSIDNAFIKIHQTEGLKNFYIFKTDIHDFDPSIDKKILCSQIDKLLSFDNHLVRFIKSIVNENRYRLDGDDKIYTDDIIHQTGMPLGGFFENVYLHDVDFVLDNAPLYLRCGDDILIGDKDRNKVEEYANKVVSLLKEKKLTISEQKTLTASPGEKLFYLGWNIINGEVDFTENALKNIQSTIKRKTKDLLVMYGKKKIPNVLRLPSIVRYVNHYQKSEFFTSCFERITTTEGLKKIDKMIMDLIRTVVSGKTGNSKYKIKYSSIQAFGYKSLVNQYYEYISSKK